MSEKPGEERTVRPGMESDLAALNDLYNHFVVETAVTFDVTPIDLAERRRWFRTFDVRGPHRLLVATSGSDFLGFACSKSLRPKQAYATSVETTIYLKPEATGRGIGTQLYAALLDTLADEDLHRAYAGITVPNEASIALHRKLGFQAIGTYDEVGRKFGRYWSVCWFEKRLGPEPGSHRNS